MLSISRDRFEDVMRKRFFYTPAFEIYGRSAGLYDYGPPGCAIMSNLLQIWRRHFILEDSLFEIETTCVTPGIVLETSGHVARFKDFMVRDISTSAFYRADHLLEDRMQTLLSQPDLTPEQIAEYTQVKNRADDYLQEELAEALIKYQVKAPETGAEITNPFPFNLMFQTSIGPSNTVTGYLRPETAQGIFVNFNKLLDYNGGKIPFGAATIGRAFRNEISPRQGLLRVREFTLAEIEYFVHPEKKDHDRFDSIRHLQVNLLPRQAQLIGDGCIVVTLGKNGEAVPAGCVSVTLGEAVDTGMINNQTLGYYIGRCQLFLLKIGAQPQWIRFRQHLANEMAHYAADCWDAELLTTYGWIECIGNADRAGYDLSVHTQATGQRLAFWEPYSEPQMVSKLIVKPNKAIIGKQFKDAAPAIFQHLNQLSVEEISHLQDTSTIILHDQPIRLTPDSLTFETVQEQVHGHYITPCVIEPSFGMGRIMYAILEQSYYQRADDTARGVLALQPMVAPIKCAIFPLMVKPELLPATHQVHRLLIEAGISCKMDCSAGSIGKRYAKADELGIPFAITIDYQTLGDSTVTLRQRDSMVQTRIPILDIDLKIAKL